MKTRIGTLVLVAVTSLAFAKQPPNPTQQGGNDLADLKVTIHLDRAEMKQMLGVEPPPNFVLMEVQVRPKGDKPYKVDRDDFVLVNHNDGQRASPFSPEQLAGTGALVVRPGGRMGGAIAGPAQDGPIWGGIGGRPQQIPGKGGIAGGGSEDHSIDAKIEGGKEGQKKDSPLLVALKDKVLAEKEITDRENGLLYFVLDGKLKLKDLELIYKNAAGKVNIEFK